MGLDTNIIRYKSLNTFKAYRASVTEEDAYRAMLWDKYHVQISQRYKQSRKWEDEHQDADPVDNPYSYDETTFANDDEKRRVNELAALVKQRKAESGCELLPEFYSGKIYWFNQWAYSRHPDTLEYSEQNEVMQTKDNENPLTRDDLKDLVARLKKVLDDCPIVGALSTIDKKCTIQILDKEFVNKVFPIHKDWIYGSRPGHNYYRHTFEQFYDRYKNLLNDLGKDEIVAVEEH